jgi:prolyl oligopeptidase
MSGRKAILAAAVAAAALTTGLSAQPASNQAAAEPYEFSYLDDIEGERALAWARAENEKTLAELTSDPRYQQYYDRALQILQARDRIPGVAFRPDGLHNFWQDESHVRGIWRRTNMASYRTNNPQWETILDIDALSKAENANWVYRGANCLAPRRRAASSFSPTAARTRPNIASSTPAPSSSSPAASGFRSASRARLGSTRTPCSSPVSGSPA